MFGRAAVLVAAAFTVMGLSSPRAAEAPGSTDQHRITIVSRAPMPGSPDVEVVSFLVELAPGEPIVKHYHPGLGFGVVLDGAFFTQSDDEPRHELRKGDHWSEPAGHIHWGGNTSTTAPTRFMVVRLLPKGQQPTIPVK